MNVLSISDMVKLRTVKCTDVASSNVCKITSHYSKFKQRKLIENQKRTHLNGALAQLARAPALQAGCQGFESLMLHHYKIIGMVQTLP